MKRDDSTRFAAAQAAFQELCDLSRADQDARLAALDPELAAEVALLLASDRGDRQPLERRAVDWFTGLGKVPATGAHPERIGEYTIHGVLGSGGMGIVYDAQQNAPYRRVALKLVQPGMMTPERVRRFELEASVLASLSHPGIAQIYATGLAETPSGLQPYIAMELVQGQRLDLYAKTHKLAINARLELIAELCDAVQHAHQRGVVHRDLKPANILVTDEGRPKILDFGVARLTDHDVETLTSATALGDVLGTLPYMSPEQVAGDPTQVDTRADVYSIGILAYELLSGRRPLDLDRRNLAEAARIVTEDEPTTLGAVNRALRGDIETIVRAALEKDKERRYPSAAALASDVRRHLAHEPIEARPPSTAYQLAKFARRNRGLVAGLALAFAVLAAGAGTSTVLYLRSQQNLARATRAEGEWQAAARNAETEASFAREVSRFLTDLFAVSDPSGAAGASITGLELLDRGREQIEQQLVDQPDVRAELLNTMGRVYFNLGQYEIAAPLLDDSIRTLRADPDADPLELATALFSRGETLHYEGAYDEVEPYYTQALALRQANLPPGDLEIAHTLDVLGRLYRDLGGPGDLERARGLAKRAQDMRILGGADPMTLSESLQSLGALAVADGDLDQAEVYTREALELREALPSARFRVPELRHQLGRLAASRGDSIAAEALFRQCFDESVAAFGAGHIFVSHSLSGIASMLSHQGRLDEAEQVYLDALALIPDAGSPAALQARTGLAFLKHDRGDLIGAEEQYRELLRISTERVGAHHPMTLVHQNNLVTALLDQGRPAEALPLIQDVVTTREQLGLRDIDRATATHNLAKVLQALGQTPEALTRYQETLSLFTDVFGPTAPRTKAIAATIAELKTK